MRALRLTAAAAILLSAWPAPALARQRGVKVVELPAMGAAVVKPTVPGIQLSQLLTMPAAKAPSALVPAAEQAAKAVAAAAPKAEKAALPALQALAPAQAQTPGAKAQPVSGQVYDGAATRKALEASEPVLTPSFEPAMQSPVLLSGGGNGGSGKSGNGGGGGNGRGNGNGGGGARKGGNDDGGEGLRPLSFPNQAQVSRLQSFDPDQMLYGILKRIRPSAPRPKWAKDKPRDPSIPANSREYWAKYTPGKEVEIVSRGENVFGGRKTKITEASFKAVGKLTREDLKGVFPAAELRAPLAQIRKAVIDRMEEERRTWQPTDPPVTAQTVVRVIKFKSFAQLFREQNGADAIPAPAAPAPRAPLQATAEGKLSPMANFLPRVVYLDVDALDGPATPELLSDMMKLQRTGVYFVALSRKPYDAPGGVHDKLIRRMSAYQLSIQLPIRFMAVVEDGNVVLEFPRGGNPKIASAARLSPAVRDVVSDAAQKSAETLGLSPRAFKALAPEEKPGPKENPVRVEFAVAKTVTAAQLESWVESFKSRLSSQLLKLNVRVVERDGGRLVSVAQDELSSSFERLQGALGDKFGLYVNPSDILVLSDDASVRKANPYLDFAETTGLKGSQQVENALGLLLGDHRQGEAGDLTGSASRISQFRRDRTRYMSEFLIKQDGQEQNINFYSGHVVHAANDWLIWSLQNGKRPTEAEYEANLRQRWEEGLHDIKAVGLPPGEDMRGWLDSRVEGALNMYRQVVAAHERGEILVGAEIPNFFMLKDREKRTEKVKRRYVVHTIFDFVALRPNPKDPTKATVVIYDFKTGPAQSRGKLEQDIQVLTYSLFARLRWLGKEFPTPYFSGDKPVTIEDVRVEFIYNALRQPTTIDNWSLDKIRKTIVSTLNGIHASEQKMLGVAPAKKKPAKKGAKAAKAKKAPSKKPVSRRSPKP